MRKEKVKVYLCSCHVWKCVLCLSTRDNERRSMKKPQMCDTRARATRIKFVVVVKFSLCAFLYYMKGLRERCMYVCVYVYASDLDSVKEQIIRFMDDTALYAIFTQTQINTSICLLQRNPIFSANS